MALHGGEAIKRDVSLGSAGFAPQAPVNGSAGGCGAKDQVSYNRVEKEKGWAVYSLPLLYFRSPLSNFAYLSDKCQFLWQKSAASCRMELRQVFNTT